MWRNNGLSLVLVALFALCLAGESVSGWKAHNDEQRRHGEPELAWSAYVRSADFAEGVFENWESEFLQMGMYVVLTVFLFQRGSAESKDPDRANHVDEDPARHRDTPAAPWPVRRGGWVLKLYGSSLSLAFLLLFLVSFALHAESGARLYNEERLLHGEPLPLSTAEYMRTARFWYESLQNWQSEFLAVLAIVVLSVWLRQRGSPESKPVHAPHAKTGEG